MKLSSRVLSLVVISSLILTISCGKKSTGRYGGLGGGGNISNANMAQIIATYRRNFPCQFGDGPNISFSVGQSYSGSGNITQIQGQLQQNLIGGTYSNSYVGVNTGVKQSTNRPYNDIIVISKMIAGTNVIGFNIWLSLCKDVGQISGGYGYPPTSIPIIDQSRPLRIQGSTPIIVSDPTNCAVGTVDQATVYIYIPSYQRYPEGGIIPTSFTRANCLCTTPNCY